MTAPVLKPTPLLEEHVRLGAKMVPFAGFEMPIQYPSGITAEHRAVRTASGLFDVSHMGEFDIRGPQALDLVQRVTVNDASTVEIGRAQYSAMCREDGGILDDLLVYRFRDRWMLVVNAANRERDLAWVLSHGERLDVAVEDRSDAIALIAVQGPYAREAVRGVTDAPVDGIGHYRFIEEGVTGADAVISATGYTGEDGFELYVEADAAPTVWRALLEAGEGEGPKPCGLGARDSLRLEMGYPLYGNDLDEEHTPLEAGLGWMTKLDKEDFVGRDALVRQSEAGVERRLVGLVLGERGFPRAGYGVFFGDRLVGRVTSGVLSPTLGVGIAMAYVPTESASPGSELAVEIRGKRLPATVVKPPFYREGSIRR
jgi:aminomethyltransferase